VDHEIYQSYERAIAAYNLHKPEFEHYEKLFVDSHYTDVQYRILYRKASTDFSVACHACAHT